MKNPTVLRVRVQKKKQTSLPPWCWSLLLFVCSLVWIGSSMVIVVVEAYSSSYSSRKNRQRQERVILPTTPTTTSTFHKTHNNDVMQPRNLNRREWFQQLTSTATSSTTLIFPLTAIITTTTTTLSPVVAHGVETTKTTTTTSTYPLPVMKLIDARDVLETLVSNWNRATIDCTYADVSRDLLETKNKEKLLEKASTFALFDKEGSVETCKTSNKIVRDYLGATGKGPLVGIDKTLKQGLEYIKENDDNNNNNNDDDDGLDIYVTEVEQFLQSLSKALSLSYASGTADFDSMNNFDKDSILSDTINPNSNLEQARISIIEAKTSLDKILSVLI